MTNPIDRGLSAVSEGAAWGGPVDAIPFTQLRRVLVIKMRHHGDVLLTSPVFSALKAAAPQVEIDALVYGDTAPMLSDHPDIAQIFKVTRRGGIGNVLSRLLDDLRLFWALRRRQYDLIIQLTHANRGAFLARLLQPRYSAVSLPAKVASRSWFARSFTHCARVPPAGRRHTVELHLDVLRRLGLEINNSQSYPLVFVPGEAARSRVEALLADKKVPQNFIHLHPVSRWMFKSWRVESYAALIDALQRLGKTVVVTGAPVKVEQQFVDAILARCQTKPASLAGQLSLKELGAVIARARLSVSVDSVPMHLAAAMDTPVVALFGPSCEIEWGPWLTAHRIVASATHTCRPCRIDGCGGGKRSNCLLEIGHERVLSAIDNLLAEKKGNE